MTDKLSVVVKVATNPDQAKIYVTMLQAEGIPAFTDPDGAADEFAMSQRLMNLSSVKVMVPASAQGRAREILQPVQVDADELAQQAMAATGERETPTVSHASGKGGSLATTIAVIASALAALFLVMWLDSTVQPSDPTFDFVTEQRGTKSFLRGTKRITHFHRDTDFDGVYESVIAYGPIDGERYQWTETLSKLIAGHYRQVELKRADDFTTRWTASQSDGPLDHCNVMDETGRIVQSVKWVPNKGFVVTNN